SLGLSAPEIDSEEQWFGHGGAWGTNCSVNWHTKQLKLYAVQFVGNQAKISKAYNEAAAKFFKAQLEKSGVDEYTGRMK
ncbi:MAG: hypothetical protein J5833_06890, partial [Victivallales bacterium]|nr:hypothetical protein [Victivallales bacterium]